MQKTAWQILNRPMFRVTSLRKMAIEAWGIAAFFFFLGFFAGIIVK